MPRTFHIVGAGLAGLSAAAELAGAGERVAIYEAAGFAGGRCRSYDDPVIGMTIDNGNHLLLSGNGAVFQYLRRIGAEQSLVGPVNSEYAFVDLATGERWTLQINDGRFPFWIFDPRKRVPKTRVRDYVAFGRLLAAVNGAAVGDVIDCSGALYQRLLGPLLRAALNIDPRCGSAKLARAVARETLAAGGRACRPMIARDGLARAMVDPAVSSLKEKGAKLQFSRRLSGFEFDGAVVRALAFDGAAADLGRCDVVILAVPPIEAAALLPGLRVPNEFSPIVNAHFRVAPPPSLPPLTAILNGTAEWVFAFPDRISVTISAANHIIDEPREILAQKIWRDVARVTGLPDEAPPWQIVRERRATFAATPSQEKLRPGAETAWRNLFIAGDWTDTGLPATMEGAVRSGIRAARLAQQLDS